MASNGGGEKLPGVTGGRLHGSSKAVEQDARATIGQRRGDFKIVISGFGKPGAKGETTTEETHGTATISGPADAIHALRELGIKGEITVMVPKRKPKTKTKDK